MSEDNKPKILITINTDGSVKIEPVNFKGESCTAASKPLTDALVGSRPEEFKFKDEYYQRKAQVHRLKEKA